MDEDTSPKTPYVYLYNTGHVYDDKPLRVVSSCLLEIYTFPFDIQNCTLTFGAYVHFGKTKYIIIQPIKSNSNFTAGFCELVTKLWDDFISAEDVKMVQGATAEEILAESRQVIQSNGEWDLIGIHVVPYDLELEDGSYSQIAYYVSTLAF